ncbi:hypothetical protein ATL17_1598 [Maritalea mobilis]|uniref:Uncharacterized protein n=1 Tax=Maritalea mobilis TaxID=483324 RepID=A0A4R6VTT3_9HYPH|nr:hypothetical protein [Maritalea mobilis]TDQ63591.1 hypothetical protein ATL17_1598 [Maritalea mobilis]
MNLLETISAMRAAGVSAETILEVVERVENERLAKQRARKAKCLNNKKSGNVPDVTERAEREKHSADECENAKPLKNMDSGNVPNVPVVTVEQKEKENSPHTPQKKNKNILYNPPKSPRKSIADRYGDEGDPIFSNFLNTVWSHRWRDGDNRKNAFKAFAKLKDADKQACRDALPKAKAKAVQTDNQFRPMMASWINRNGWEEISSQATTQATETDWQGRIEYFNKTGVWAQSWGPKPGEHGCKAPSHLTAPKGEAA